MMVKKTIWLFLVLSFIFSLAACTKQQVRYRPLVGYEREEELDDVVILENNYLELRFLPETAGIILRDKASGTLWHSTPADAANDTLSSVVMTDLMMSQFSLQYANVSGVGETLYSNTQSIARGAYEYSIVDGSLEVNYTVGNVPRTFILPFAAPESRILPYLQSMDNDARRRVEASYRLYDIDNLRSTDNRSELLSQFPDLANEKVYVLRENTQEFMREQIEELFAEAGYTRDDYYEDTARYAGASGAERPAFTITLRYTLDGKALKVNIPFDRIAYHPSYPIIRLDVLPFFGAGGLNDEGYLLVPDGSGALIYFNNGKYSQLASTNPIYGWDEAAPRDAVIIDNKAPYPVFGIQKNGAAMLCIIEEGAAYASVQADVSGRNSSYNRVFPYFEMIHGAVMDISGRSDRDVYLYESGLQENESITLRYAVCENDGYVGMAKEYRAWMLNKYPSLANRPPMPSGVPVAIEIVGAVNKTQHRLGIPFDLPLRLTSYNEAEDMIHDFAKFGWRNVSVKLTGWFNRSYEHTVPNDIKLIRELGNKRNFTNLVSAADQYGYDLYPEADFVYMRDLRTFDGFNLYRDAARYVTRKRVERYPFSFVWFGERIRWGKLSYLARPAVTMNMIDIFMDKASGFGLNNIAFRNMGAKLGGDYNERRRVSRETAMIMRQEKFDELSRAGNKMMIGTGFDYCAPWADIIVDMALECQGYSITDVSVPFYQIALSGLVPYTGRAINLAEDYTKNLLRIIESGAGLYFSFMKEETVELQETKFRQFYANEYDKWVYDAHALYTRFTNDFAGLYGQEITNHIILAPGITVTVYSSGAMVAVNRSDKPWVYEGTILRADSYVVLR